MTAHVITDVNSDYDYTYSDQDELPIDSFDYTYDYTYSEQNELPIDQYDYTYSDQYDLSSDKITVTNSIREVIQIMDMMPGSIGPKNCMLCYDSPQQISICSNCDNKLCHECVTSLVNISKPGELFEETMMLCPFCRVALNGVHVKPYNKELGYLLGAPSSFWETCCSCTSSKSDDGSPSYPPIFDPKFYYAWCLTCRKIKEAIERDCGDENNISIEHFVCQSCQEINLGNCTYKNCPGCGNAYVKVGGCNRITCAYCKISWCYWCNYANRDKNKVYDHLKIIHGNIW